VEKEESHLPTKREKINNGLCDRKKGNRRKKKKTEGGENQATIGQCASKFKKK